MAIGRLCAVLLISLSTGFLSALPALDIQGSPPAFLSTMVTPAWRMTPLPAVLDEVAKVIAIPMKRSPEIAADNGWPVLLSAVKPLMLKDTLMHLEHSAQLHITVTGESMTVERITEYNRRRAEPRWYPLTDYALGQPLKDTPYFPLGIYQGMTLERHPHRHFSVFHPEDSNRKEEMQTWNPEEVKEFVRNNTMRDSWENEGVGIEARSSDLIVAQTPEVHAQIHACLMEIRARENVSKRWQVTFGVIAADARITTGIVSNDSARTVVAKLGSTVVLSVSGRHGQRVQTTAGEDRAVISDIHAVGNHLDPDLKSVRLGRSATITAFPGQQHSLVMATLEWVEEVGKPTASEVRAPAHTIPATTKTVDKTATGEQATTSTNAQDVPGERIPLNLPTLWCWRPDLDCFLPLGSALILSSEHPRGQAVMVLEELP